MRSVNKKINLYKKSKFAWTRKIKLVENDGDEDGVDRKSWNNYEDGRKNWNNYGQLKRGNMCLVRVRFFAVCGGLKLHSLS